MIGKYVQDMFKKSPLACVIVSCLAVFLIAYILFGFITAGATVYDSLFKNKEDIFMDFFNSAYYSLNNPYTEHSVIYPPLVTLIYEGIGKFIAIDGAGSGFDLRASYLGMFSYMISVVISLIMIHYISTVYTKKKCVLTSAAILLILFSYPVLFAIMRGNCILFAVLFIMLFLLGYKSKDKKIRYISYICLGIATGFKIYVVLFGFLVLKERNIKDIVICIIIGILVLFVPFLFTDGGPILFFKNAFSYSIGDSVNSIVNINDIFSLLTKCGLNNTIADVFVVIMVLFTYLLTLVLIVMNKNVHEWEAVTLISTNIIFGFGSSVAYAFVLMIPALLMFMNNEFENNKKNLAISVLFALIFAIFPGIGALGGSAYFITIKGLSTMVIYIIVVISIIKRYGLINKYEKKFIWDDKQC